MATMKKKNISIFDPSALQTSSTKLALQQLNKEAEKRESANEAAKVRCPKCCREIAPTRRCPGHGSGGGGGSEGTSNEKSHSIYDTHLNRPEKAVKNKENLITKFDTMDSEELEIFSSEKGFAKEIIAELVDNELLLLDNDRDSMTLSITLQCKPNLLTEKVMEAIQKEFKALKEKHSLSADCMQIKQDEKGNILSLQIKMPTLALYDAFIQRLSNNLLPIPSPKVLDQDESRKTQSFAPNPLSMKPKPSSTSKEIDKINDNTEQGISKLTPFKKTPWEL